ncbi:MAG TPA: hypothetical protein VN934_07025 [Candidatus Tumulicola sp.]|nr:hypothetical protein [Candidatus Tumulicola sp.]
MLAARIAAAFGSTMILFAPAIAATTTAARAIPPRKADLFIHVVRNAGICPKTVGLWTWFKSYEGGGDNFVVADTLAIAGAARRTKATKTRVEFTAPLHRDYATCVGAGLDKDSTYSFAFAGGNVRFRVELKPTTEHPAIFVDSGLVKSRPFVEWAIGD